MENVKALGIILVILGFAALLICPYLLTQSTPLASLKPAKSSGSLSVIIYHDSCLRNLKRLTALLLSHFTQSVEIIVVSHSSDEKLRQLSLSYSFTSIVLQRDKEKGKERGRTREIFHAFYEGSRNTKGNTLLFLSSSLRLTPQAFSHIYRAFRPGCVVSVAPKLKCRTIDLFSPLRAVAQFMQSGAFSLGSRKKSCLYPYFMMIDRHDYFNVCTHDMVASRFRRVMLLTEAYRKAGLNIRVYCGGSLVCCEAMKNDFEPGNILTTALLCIYLLSAALIAFSLCARIIIGSPDIVLCWLYLMYSAVFLLFAGRFSSCGALRAAIFPLWSVLGITRLMLSLVGIGRR